MCRIEPNSAARLVDALAAIADVYPTLKTYVFPAEILRSD